MGIVELGLLLAALALALVFAVLAWRFFGSSQRPLGSGETPGLPPKRAAAAPREIVHIHRGVDLAGQLREHAHAAEERGLRPFLEFGAVWCPPSKMFGEILEDPRMQDALRGIYLIRAELDDFDGDPRVLELRPTSVPVFYELDAEGQWTGRQINGGAWGDDTVENMSQTMSAFFQG
jgi:hypothetical protein